MNETEFHLQKLFKLIEAYVELVKTAASPGEKSIVLNSRIDWLERRIRELLA